MPLWRLSRTALASPQVRQILTASAAAAVPAALAGAVEGQTFLADLRAYLEEYGQGVTNLEVSHPSYSEDPTPVLDNLKQYLTQPDRDIEAELAAQTAAREQSVAQTRERLQGYPRQVVDRFERALTAAQEAVVLTEDHGLWIEFRGGYQVRRVFLECGARFTAAGVMDTPEDVFYLMPDEVRETAMVLSRLDRRRLIAGRRAEMAYFRTITPPPALGTVPPGPPPDDPLNRAIGDFFGAPPPAPAEPDVVRGTAGSPGRVRGPACVIRTLADAEKLRQGDVLVAETTAPPWTPLFATAIAVVTDTGGILSHCAIVAREYGIPAVVGTGAATALICDGQIVEVDGSAGLVRIMSPAGQ
jgi:pyruvate,water dikinase